AEEVVAGIERRFQTAGHRLPTEEAPRLAFLGHHRITLGEVVQSLFWAHRRRAAVGLSLMASQAFFYNAIFCPFALVLIDFGGIIGPLLFGALIETGSRSEVFTGYLIGAVLMVGAAIILLVWGVKAERRPLESVCRPLTMAE